MKRRAGLFSVIAVVLVAVGGGAAYYHWMRGPAQTQPQATTTVRTTRAFRGDLIVSATGAGTIIPATEVVIGFPSTGTLTELNVQVGDTVKAGDVLARIDELEARKALSGAEAQLLSAQGQLDAARHSYAELTAGPEEAELLQAEAAVLAAEQGLAELEGGPTQAELAAAQAAVLSAEEAYRRLAGGPDADELARQELQLAQAKNSLWAAQLGRDARGNERDKESGSYDQAQASVLNSEIAVRLAEMDLAALKQPASEADLQAASAELARCQQALAELRAGPSEAELAAAKAELAQARKALDDLTATDAELDASEAAVRQAELNLSLAEMELESARRNLDNTALVAPFDGTVIDVTAQAGESAGGEFVTLARVGQPMLEVYLDETDMDRVAVGYEAEVVFEAKPELTFHGYIVQVNPALVAANGMQAVRALVELAPESFAKPQNLLLGMNATVDVIGGRAVGAVLVPVEALREIDDGAYGVFVMEDGELRFRVVEVGLMDLTYAEIVSGLASGDVVSTGMVETR